jgi:myo-inositol-1(or 4)-monophosphatase
MAASSILNHRFAAFASALADAAGEAIRPHYRRPLAVDSKGPVSAFDPVTIADRAAEQSIRALINAQFPDHGIIGEEFGTERRDAEYLWVIDPVDGTRAFMSGIPTWGTLIGLLQHGHPVLGVLDQPHMGERFMGDTTSAIRSGSNGDAVLQTRQGVALSDAIVWVSSTITTHPALFSQMQRLAGQVRMLRYGSDCVAMAMLAEGHIDAVIEAGLEIFDIAAQVPIVTGAGGVFTALDGTAPLLAHSVLAAGDSALHANIIAVLSSDEISR